MNDIEYINKTIYTVSSKLKLKHQVKFGKKNQKNERIGSVYARDFTSKSYNVDMNLSSINLDTSDYLILEYYENKDNNISIYLSYPHLYNFKRFLKKARNWFYSTKYEDLFIESDDDIKLNGKFKRLRIETDITIDSKLISLKPAIVERNDIYEEGVIMGLNGEFVVSLDVDQLEALCDIFENFNLYESSLLLTHYVLTSHPEEMLVSSSSRSTVQEKIPKTDEFRRKRKRKVN